MGVARERHASLHGGGQGDEYTQQGVHTLHHALHHGAHGGEVGPKRAAHEGGVLRQADALVHGVDVQHTRLDLGPYSGLLQKGFRG